MPVLKAPPPQPKNETIQLRIPQDVKFRLLRYAEFIQTSASFIVVELLERFFRKDADFQAYLASYRPPTAESHIETLTEDPSPSNPTKP